MLFSRSTHSKHTDFREISGTITEVILGECSENTQLLKSKRQDILNYDDILTDIGMGFYHYKILGLMGILSFSVSAQLLVVSVIIGILYIEWNITDLQASQIISFKFVGQLIGSFLLGYISDIHGRRFTAILAGFGLCFFSFCSAFCSNINMFNFMRCLVGVFLGLSFSLCSGIVAETVQLEYRGIYGCALKFFHAFGEIFTILVAWALFESLEEGNWQLLLIIMALIGFTTSILIALYYTGSARYQLLTGNFQAGFDILREIIRETNPEKIYYLEDAEQKQKLKNWALMVSKNSEQASFQQLFKEEYAIITPIVWCLYLSYNILYYGMIYTIPLTMIEADLGIPNQNFKDLVIINLAQFPAIIVSAFIVEIEGLGRKNSLIISYLCASINFFLSYYFFPTFFIGFMIIGKFFTRIIVTLCIIYASEIYGTKYRMTGLGYASTVSCFGGIILPIFAVYFTHMNPALPYLAYSVVSFITSICTMMLPYDLRGKNLDQVETRAIQLTVPE